MSRDWINFGEKSEQPPKETARRVFLNGSACGDQTRAADTFSAQIAGGAEDFSVFAAWRGCGGLFVGIKHIDGIGVGNLAVIYGGLRGCAAIYAKI